MDLTLYQKMIGANNSNMTQAYINDSISHVNDMFSKSPSYRKVVIDGVDSDCIINRKKSHQMDLLLRPNFTIDKGSYVVLGLNTFIVMDFIENEIYPKANVNLCNRSLRWKDSQGEIKEYKCFVTGTTYEEDDAKIVYNSDGELTVQVQFNDDTKAIKPQMRFIFDESVYEVTSIDTASKVYNGKGFMKLILKFTNTTDTDDKDNQIADSSGNSGWGGW
ncbi:hypothetical protein [Paenibacillus agilis]|uniref:Uncharacterized protein n=1 Tax=Paenibacillus agilis TaxID=3020863 RepID=A0A559IEI5_9BACL|nr:hypothetical protein [Paenibacillus agilis]TVX86074.1 hypothetical protein FPZ44_24350 [Paenibacillus agilis]